ncbi:FAD-dependent oxidoreductase [Sphingomonas pokkalii]|uniref:Monooxygenase n=1 Tax=Sphingomonas pokkalii TaxID=2175090 RepID=A0A2U0SJQ8_9SPHN|nr:FAD-dependent oxidoreductase [Sphingomonas pokkalii]PVX31578.1 monooxygenase [Sphingomonas pokkalii]
MSDRDRVQVVVVGAGPVGCVAGMLLARQGIDVMLVEKGEDCAADMRASTFHPPTLEMLEQLDITPRLIERGLKAPIYHWRDRRSGEVLAFDLTEIADVTRHPYRIQCEQYHLSRMLAERLEETPNAAVQFNHRLVHFAEDDRGVDLALETPMEIRRVRADYVIAADGASSIVRKWLRAEFHGFTYPEKFLTLSTDEPLEAAIPGLAHVNYVADPEEWLVLLKVPKLWRVLVPTFDQSDNAVLTSDANKNAIFERLIGHGADVRTFHRTIYRVHQRVAKSFRHGRVFLAGDAAHLNNPLGGFGMNSGIHDAFNLTEKLLPVLQGRGGEAALDRYDRQRRTVTHDFTQQQTIQNMELMKAGQSEAYRMVRDQMRALSTNDEARRTYLLRQSMITSVRDAAAID